MNKLTKVVCMANDDGDLPLTINKIYDIFYDDLSDKLDKLFSEILYYQIIGDDDLIEIYSKSLFISLEEYRNNKLNNLGII